MASTKIVIQIWLIVCTYYHPVVSDCDDFELTIATPIKQLNGNFMSYINNKTYIQCNFTCGPCVKQYLLWTKDTQQVYAKFWTGDPSGPLPGYEDTVEFDENEDVGMYQLMWLQTKWDDLPGPNIPTSWTCTVERQGCFRETVSMDVDYFRYPELTYHANGDVVEEYNAVANITSGTVSCTVLSNPICNITLMHYGEVISTNSSCSPYNEYESICSLSVPNVNLTKGFHCNVEYDSPETGNMTAVTPDGCCPNGLYPSVLPEPLDCMGVCEWWEWLLIALGCVGFVGGMAGIVVMVKEKKGRTADQHADTPSQHFDASKQHLDASNQPSDASNQPSDASNQPSDASNQPSDNPSMQPKDVEIKTRPNQSNEGVNANRSEEEKM